MSEPKTNAIADEPLVTGGALPPSAGSHGDDRPVEACVTHQAVELGAPDRGHRIDERFRLVALHPGPQDRRPLAPSLTRGANRWSAALNPTTASRSSLGSRGRGRSPVDRFSGETGHGHRLVPCAGNAR